MITAEFRMQAEKEEQAGIPITPFMKDIKTDEHVAKVQFGFCFYVVLPWYEAVEASELFDFESKVDHLHASINYYDCRRKGVKP